MWTHLDVHLPTNRAWCGTARINNKVFCVGGKQASANNTTLSDLVMLDLSECNDLSTLDTTTTDEVIEWKSMTPMQEGRHRFACVAHKESIYVFGGKNDKGAKVATCERYDAADNAWKRLPNLPCGPNNGCAAGVVGDKIYVVGGMGNDGTILASTMIFDTTTQTWNDNNSQKVPDMKLTRWGLSVVVVDQYLVAMGGDFEKTIEVLDTKSNSWNFAPLPMNHNDKSLPMADVVGEDEGEILVAGGLVGIRATSMAERISFRKGLFPENVRFEEWRARAIGNNSNRRDAKIVKSLAASYKGYTKEEKAKKQDAAPNQNETGRALVGAAADDGKQVSTD
eukprot:CAMPEP_0116134796 /NCGR_PEP_ID=MMETSP0329-20121206/10843_1 /TAXON_ID=697910 /ORGANISM="Pseudo-nitzschia arenysensis, Strain B593" /LENGTH=337 /DNA_ID=CAMNT_0003629543 /DNA_START=217 /DNA_END=1231 /DNA_ORIENTATION=+